MIIPAGDPEDDYGVDENYETEEQLALDDDDGSLPWLEDDEYYEEEGGFDGRLIWGGLLAFMVLAALLLAGWWFSRDQADPELSPDGSTIEAPEGAYKQAPENPGGRQVEGTGDTAYQVAEGESQRGILADDGEVAAPSIDRDQGSSESESDNAGAVYVQIGAFTSRSDADQAWATASSRYSGISGMRHRVVEAEVNGATVYRLQAIAADRAAGDAACRSIRNAGGDCYIR